MQLLGPDIDIPQEDIVGDDALDKGRLVVLLLIVCLGTVQGHCHHGADELGLLITALGKGGVVEAGAAVGQGLKGLVPIGHRCGFNGVQGGSGTLPFFSDPGQMVAGDHRPLVVNDADDAVRTLFHLKYDALEYSAGHGRLLLFSALILSPGCLPAMVRASGQVAFPIGREFSTHGTAAIARS